MREPPSQRPTNAQHKRAVYVRGSGIVKKMTGAQIRREGRVGFVVCVAALIHAAVYKGDMEMEEMRG